MVSAQVLSGRFVKGVAESATHEASFELGGFVTEELKERTNKEGVTYRYDLALGQANYSNDMMQRFVIHVDPVDREIIKGVQTYRIGDTVSVNGDLRFVVETKTVESKSEGGFGAGVIRTYTNTTRSFFIRGGSAPIRDEAKGMYPSDMVRALVSAYKEKDVELMAKAKDSSSSNTASNAPTVTSRQTSLI